MAGQRAYRQPMLGEVVAMERQTDPGKLARYDLMLHVPYCAADVVRHCLPAGSRQLAVGFESDCGPARVAILAGASYMPDGVTEKAQACYPRVLAELRHLEVRAR